MKNGKEHVIVADIDETLVNSVTRHVEWLTREGLKRGWSPIPTLPQVLALGGTRNAYKHVPEYDQLNLEMRTNPEFNMGLQPIDGVIDAIPMLSNLLVAYLTTRPMSLQHISQSELCKLGFPKKPVICRPEVVDLRHTEEWKLWTLMQLVELTGKKAIMIDDNPKMHSTIVAANHPKIVSIPFAGPITPKNIGAQSWKDIMKKLGE